MSSQVSSLDTQKKLQDTQQQITVYREESIAQGLKKGGKWKAGQLWRQPGGINPRRAFTSVPTHFSVGTLHSHLNIWILEIKRVLDLGPSRYSTGVATPIDDVAFVK